MDGGQLSNIERRLLRKMKEGLLDNCSVPEILEACEWTDQAIAVGAAQGLCEKGLAEQKEEHSTMIRALQNGQIAIEKGLLEERIFSWIQANEHPTMAQFQTNFERSEAGPGIGLMKKLGMSTNNGQLSFEHEQSVLDTISDRKLFLSQLPMPIDECDGDLLEHFKQRKQYIEIVESIHRTWNISSEGSRIEMNELIIRASSCI